MTSQPCARTSSSISGTSLLNEPRAFLDRGRCSCRDLEPFRWKCCRTGPLRHGHVREATRAGAPLKTAAWNSGYALATPENRSRNVSTTKLQGLFGYIEDALPPAPGMSRARSRSPPSCLRGRACGGDRLRTRPPWPAGQASPSQPHDQARRIGGIPKVHRPQYTRWGMREFFVVDPVARSSASAPARRARPSDR
jgi:hypothetical protein